MTATAGAGATLEMIPVEAEGWLARDRAYRDGDARGLLGFAQANGHGLDVVWLAPQPSSEFLAHLEDFIEAASARCLPQPAADGLGGPRVPGAARVE